MLTSHGQRDVGSPFLAERGSPTSPMLCPTDVPRHAFDSRSTVSLKSAEFVLSLSQQLFNLLSRPSAAHGYDYHV